MTGKPKEGEGAEGWESLSGHEEPVGSLAPNPELEEALREAADAVEQATGKRQAAAEEASAQDSDAERLETELGEQRDRMVRLQADFENFRRRAIKERQEVVAYGHENLVKDLLGTVDNLDRAIDHARSSGAADLDVLLQGVELVQREFLTALESHGLIEIEAEEKVFDPSLHEAMGHEPDASVPAGTVIKVLQKGYLLRAHLLRPARVVVAKAPEEDSDSVEPGGGETE